MTAMAACTGDWIEVNLIGGSSRRGRILEVLGKEGHEHYRVRWDEEHESIHFPADGTHVLHEAPDGTLSRASKETLDDR
jgi:Domain of unknown function (DUF1918)